ncbi:hypothetical protein BASA83_000897 [Batrachochytrium salamandrivorans]|nr:hypothetical protein BASA81_004335 [Batrachochytrium salamandrivorans]KAH9276762.1 hypothetical protein BASA83_000897 [Batrachochytrium salamandrivorans]
MKFNALVVAAMVITSVNAAGKGKFGGYSEDKDESKSVVSQDPSMSEPKPVVSQGTSNNEPDEPQDPDTTKESEDNGSNEPEVDLELLCRNLMVDLRHSHKQLFDVIYPSRVYKPPPKGRRNSLRPIKKYLTWPHQPTPEEIKKKQQTILSLKQSYFKDRNDFNRKECSTKYPHVLSQDDAEELDKLFN